MPSIRERVVIARPRDEIWAFVIDPANNERWQSNTVEAFREGPVDEVEVGERLGGAVRVAGQRIDWEGEVTEADAPERFAARSTRSPIPFTYRFVLREVDGATELTFTQETQWTGGVFGRLADGLMRRAYEKDVRGNLRTLKRRLESGDA